MNKWLIGVFVVFVVLMVALGGGPDPREKPTGKSLKTAIEEYQDEGSEKGRFAKFRESLSNPGSSGIVSPGMGGTQGLGGMPGNGAVAPKGYVPQGTLPRQVNPYAQPEAQPQIAPAEPLYPYQQLTPTRPSQPNSPFQMAPPSRFMRGAYLRSGQPLQFAGTRVYVPDENGHAKALPDGEYPMMGGSYVMVVERGERQIPSN